VTTEELALEVERLRGVLARIESLVWYEPQDDDDTVESVRAMVRERDEARAEVERLKDRCASYSEDVESLNGCVSRMETALYEARDEAAKLRERVRVVERERDEWKARATFAEKELSDAFGLPPTIGPSGGESKRVVDRLRAERRQLRRRLVECRPWVGVCPLEPAKINEVCLVRDLADDTLEEVKE
jgi:chromosome segregation ATPase